MTLNYNSRSNRHSRFGFGWNDSADIRLVRKTDGTIILIDADGREEKFSSNANGTFSSPPGNHDSLKLNKQVLFSDDMENGNGSWVADDPWGQVTSRSHSSNTSWTDSPNGNYSNSVHKALTLELDLSNTAVASMTFWHTFALENGYDFGYIEISKDDGANWTLLKSYTGYQNDWAKQTVSLNSYAGLSSLLLRFRLITDSSVTYDGWYIDDVEISGGSSYQLYRKGGSIVCFDQDGKPYRIEDRNGNAIIYTYDEDKLSAITGPDGEVLYISNDSNGRITQISDATGRVTSFTYDADNNLTSITNAAGDTWKFAYDGVHNMIAKTDPQGQTTQYSYDSDDRLLGSTDAAGNNRTVEYVSDAVTRVTDPAGNTSEYTYNNSLNVIRKVDALGNITEYTWDADLNKISVTDASGTITYSYDSFGNMLSRTDQSGSTTSYTYDALGNILTVTDAQGNVISNTYDENGNLISTTDPAGNTTTYQYDAKGRIISVTDANKRVTTFGYDAAGNLITITDPIGATISMTYDAAGNMVTMTDPTGNITTFTYDVLNRLITITDAKGNVTTYGYDKLGNRASITDANGNTTLFTYDHKGRVTKIVNALGHLTVFTYTDAGCPSCSDTGKNSPTSITDANEQTTIFKYDALGRLIQESDPLGNWVSYTYDAQGNLISRLDAKGERTSYTYDALGRLLSITYPDDSTTSFSYDVKGNVITASNQHIGYAMEYDKLGRLTKITDSYDRTISYKYDALGNRVQMTMPDGELVTYEYDKANRLSKTVGFAGSFGLDYDELGRRTSLRYPNGVTTSYTYDTVGRLVDLLTKNAKGDILSAFSYTHDKVGNRLTKMESYKHHHHKHKRYEYTYDSIYRLLESMPVTIKKHKEKWQSKKAEIFGYDLVGNRLTGPELKDTYTYNEGNQLLTSRKCGYQYDANGNLIRKSKIDDEGEVKSWSYEYDYDNRLIRVIKFDHDETKVISFKYDPFGRRIEKTVEEIKDHKTKVKTYTYVYDNEDIILEILTRSKGKKIETSRYIHGPGIDEPLAIEQKGKVYFYHADGLGSIITLSDHKGKVVQSYEYSAFGELKHHGNKVKSSYTYTGREWDKETGLYFYRARYYEPNIGRFISKTRLGLPVAMLICMGMSQITR